MLKPQVNNNLILLGAVLVALTATALAIVVFGNTAPFWSGQGSASCAVLSFTRPNKVCAIEHAPASRSFLLILTTGFLTGLSHCAGMCGPLVSAFAVRQRSERRQIASPLALYQMGRLTTYTLLGVTMGAIGSMLNIAALIRGWQGALAFASGLLLIVMGLGLAGLLPTRKWIESVTIARVASGWIRKLLVSKHPGAPFALGLTNGLLPCGAVYAMSVLAAAGGNPWQGGLIMLIFGLGTLPAMFGIGFSISMLSFKLRNSLFQLASILIVLVGLQLVMRGLALSSAIPHVSLGGVMLW